MSTAHTLGVTIAAPALGAACLWALAAIPSVMQSWEDRRRPRIRVHIVSSAAPGRRR